MFGPKLSSLFKSRWMALIWSAMIVWMAISFVGGGKDDEGQPVSAQEAATVAHLFGDK